jgi:hypothetical protein
LVRSAQYTARPEIDINLLVEPRDVRRDVAEAVERVLKKHKEKVWITFLAGLITGLITNGIYDIIKEAVISLVRRAPYAQAQIYEVESDLYRQIDRWNACLPDEHELDNEDIFVAMTYALHALAVTAILGLRVP